MSSEGTSSAAQVRMAMLRLQSDLKAMAADPPSGCSASPVSEDNLFQWNATIIGPDESPWEGASHREGARGGSPLYMCHGPPPQRTRARERATTRFHFGRARSRPPPRPRPRRCPSPRRPSPAGGIYQIRLQFPDQYPEKAPRVRFVTEMFHPNSA
jgi:hypothetical protein